MHEQLNINDKIFNNPDLTSRKEADRSIIKLVADGTQSISIDFICKCQPSAFNFSPAFVLISSENSITIGHYFLLNQ